MNILLCPHNWHPHGAAGGEHYLNNLCQQLLILGHRIKAIVHAPEAYTHEGIECYPQGDMRYCFVNNNDLFEWADVVFTQLLGTSYAYNKCRQHGKRMVFFAHNYAKHYHLTNDALVVYNAYATKRAANFPHTNFVLQPIVTCSGKPKGRKIALINANDNKGGKVLGELAKLLPQYEFMAYKGKYGEQVIGDGVEYRENGKIDWSEIGLLLVPSEIESWSMAAQEAICHGIPVIGSPLAGLRENLSYAGIFIDRNNLPLYAETIDRLMSDKYFYSKQSELCLQRAAEFEPIKIVLEFNSWLIENV